MAGERGHHCEEAHLLSAGARYRRALQGVTPEVAREQFALRAADIYLSEAGLEGVKTGLNNAEAEGIGDVIAACVLVSRILLMQAWSQV